MFIAHREQSPASPLAIFAGAPPAVYDSDLRQEADTSPIILARVLVDPGHAESEPSFELETLEEPLLNYPLRNEARQPNPVTKQPLSLPLPAPR